MNLLALDQSSRITGYAVFEDGKLTKYDKFEFTDDDVGHRLTRIRNKVIKLIEDYDITDVAFEDIQLQTGSANNVVTYKILAEVFGVIQQLLDEKQIPYQIISSSSWKSTLQIKGAKRAEQKRNAQLWVFNNHNIKATQDVCDAICIGEHTLQKNSGFDWSD